MKKVISLFLSFVMLLSLTAGLDFSAYADTLTTGNCGKNVTYSFDSDTGTLTISGTGYMENCVGYSKFSGNNEIKTVIVEQGVTSIGFYAFYNCSNITSVIMPESLEGIGMAAFSGCSSLKSVIIPDGVTTIYSSAFRSCTSLISINVEENNTNYSSVNGVLFNRNQNELICYPAGKNDKIYEIPDSVTSIGEDTFYGCPSLTNVTIPDSVTSIGSYAFYDCTSLTSVTIPDSVTSIGKEAFYSCTSLTNVFIPNSITSIDPGTFCYCTSLKSIAIPDSVTSIGYHAFFNCTSLTSVTMPGSVTSIGKEAFYSCTSLTSVTIPGSVTSIGKEAFYGCASLNNIILLSISCNLGNRFIKYNVKIYGFENSTADKYATSNGNDFVKIYCNDYGMEHKYSKKVIKNFTCKNSGEISYTCDRCCQSYTETIPALGGEHDYNGKVIKQPTCTTKGVTRYTCSRCGDSYGEENIDALGHNYEAKVVTQPTCTAKGVTRYTCSRCGDSYDEENIEALGILGHNYEAKVVKQPTCTEKGVTRYICSYCGDSYDEENIDALGHNYEAKVVTQPTCTAKGITRYTCSRCGDSYDRNDITALGGEHNYNGKTIKQPTCTAKGVTRYTCTRCGDSYDKDDIAALGHSYTEKITKNPTCVEEGTKRYDCSRCGDSYTTSVHALGHNLKLTESVEPTLTSDGYDLYECQRTGCDYYEETDRSQLILDYNKKIYSNGTDTYKIEMPKSGYLVFDFAGESESWSVNIYDEDYKKVDALTPQYKEFYKKSYLQMAAGETVPNKNQIVTLFAGTYCVEIERLNESTNDNFSGNYEFSIDYTPSAETIKETKHNFYYDAPTAKDISLNKTYNGFLGAKYAALTYSGKDLITADERDAYKFEIPKGSGWSQLSLTLSSKSYGPFDTDCTVTVYNSEFEPCAEFTPLSVSANSTKNEIAYLYDGVYYIAVENRNPNSESSVRAPIEYSFTTKLSPSGTFACVTHRGILTKTKNPTCTKDGYKLYTCQICNAQYKEVIKATGHTIVYDDAVAATCTSSGLTKGSHCSVCGATVTAQQIVAATGHTYKQTVTHATTSKDGKIVKKCSVCGAVSTVTIAKASSVSLSSTRYTYNGSVKTPSVTVKNSKGKALTKGKDYTVTYSSGRKNVGKYSVKITFKGNYSGTVTKTFTVKPKATSVNKLTALKGGIKVYVNKQATQTTGYQIQYSASSSFANAKTVIIGKNTTLSKSITGLAKGKKYYVRVRTYKTVNGTKYYSSWSKAKSITTKK